MSEKSAFKRIFTKGNRREFRFFRIIFLKNSLPHARAALVVSRTVDKRATTRNLLRRRTREWIRTQSAVMGYPMDFIIIFKKGAEAVSRKELYEELRHAVNTLHWS